MHLEGIEIVPTDTGDALVAQRLLGARRVRQVHPDYRLSTDILDGLVVGRLDPQDQHRADHLIERIVRGLHAL